MKNLRLMFISLALALSVSNATSQNPCLVAWYKLNANATDYSGSNFNGTLYGTTPTADHFLNANSALYFNGTSDYVKLGSDFDYPQRTISLWFKADFFPTSWGAIFANDNGNLQYGMLGITAVNLSGVNMIRCNVGTAVNSTYSNALKPNEWYHFAVVVNSSYFKCYFMGTPVDSLPNTNFGHSMDGDNVAHLGCSRNFGYFFPGAIDEVQIYNCALSDEEISELYYDGVYILEANATNPPYVEVYPNPAGNFVTIDYPGYLPAGRQGSSNNATTLDIFSADGKLLKSMPIRNSKTQVDIAELFSGVYIARITDNNTTTVRRLVKE